MVVFADPLLSLNKSNRGKVAVQPKEMDNEYFDPLVGTRHTDPDNGLVYETTTPLKKQYPEKCSMDISKIRPFGIICYVYQKKPIRNKGFHGKSDKKKNAKKGVQVGYEDQLGPVRVKVYYPQDNSYQWIDEDLVIFADPLLSLNKSNRGKVAVQPKEMDRE